MKADLLSISQLTAGEVSELLDLAARVKAEAAAPLYRDALRGKTLGLLFEKPSTRTRISFEVAMNQLGGSALLIQPGDSQMGRGETLEDTARTLSRFLDGLMVRTFAHHTVELWAKHASMPIINGLTDRSHPCQALADLLTVREQFGKLTDISIAYVGDGNNMTHSLMMAAARTGMDIRVATPKGYEPDPEITARAADDAAATGGRVSVTHNPHDAVAGAHVVYTDVWASMGQEDSHDQRLSDFDGFQVNQSLMDRCADDAVFMHCLPAHRGEEVSAEVMDGPRSVVFDQAENRLHAQKAILLRLLGGAPA
ncbi:MAG: ornithine carbamoyltransferase [Leptospirillia bacterium]